MSDQRSVHVLLSPQAALVVDVFRALGDFEASYDVSVIDALERRLARASDAVTARAIVSDALLFGFALRNQRTDAVRPRPEWSLNAVGARRASADECAMLALVAGCAGGDAILADRAARLLSVRLDVTVSTLARDMGTRLGAAGITVTRRDWAPIIAQRAMPNPDATRQRPASGQ